MNISLNNSTSGGVGGDHHQHMSRLESPKIKLSPLLIEYYLIIDEINQLRLSSGAQNNIKPLFSKYLNKQMTSNHLNTSNLENIETSKKTGQENKIDMELSVLAKKRDDLYSTICKYITLTYKPRMLDATSGFPFIQYKNDIPRQCFISSEAVWWCMAHVDDVYSEADAIQFMQIMFDFDTIRHISPNQRIFIHGFHLYYIVTEENRNNNNYSYTKDYLEVGFCDLDIGSGLGKFGGQNDRKQKPKNKNNGAVSLVAVKDLLPESFQTLPITWNETLESYQSLIGEYSRAEFSGNSKKVSALFIFYLFFNFSLVF